MRLIKHIKLVSIVVILGFLLLGFGTAFEVGKAYLNGEVIVSNPGDANSVPFWTDSIGRAWEKYFFKKSKLSNIDSIFSYFFTGYIFSEQVTLGNNGWLFYKAKTDSDPIGDYEGTNTFEETDIEQATEGLKKLEDYCNANNIVYSLLIVPNKERAYPEYMPELYQYAIESRTDKLTQVLSDAGFNVINCKDELMRRKNGRPLYYSYDTHWNRIGANVGIELMLEDMGLAPTPEEHLSIQSKDLKEVGYHYCGQDDLAKMIGMREIVFDDETEYEYVEYPSIDWAKFESEQEAGEVSYFSNPKAINKAKILLIGDSFRTAMVPGICYYFSDVYVLHINGCNMKKIEEISPNYLAFQYVERYSYRICDMAKMLEKKQE